MLPILSQLTPPRNFKRLSSSASAARMAASEFANILDASETYPFQFSAKEDYHLPKGTYRKALLCKWYEAIFSVSDDKVYLVALLDCRQDNSEQMQRS